MGLGKLVPNDPRVKYGSATVRGNTYTYMLGEPESGRPRHTVFLVHGFPDLGFGWRCQIPLFVSLGYRVIVPNMLGYAGTSAPKEIEAYSLKSLSADIAELARQFVGKDGQIILGGHDWGGALVWRTAMWHPDLIAAVFSVCTPYNAPHSKYISIEDMVHSGKLPNFAYQLQLKGPDVEARLQGEEGVRQFLNAMFGGFGPGGEVGFRVSEGVQFDNLPKLRQTKLLSDEEMDFYVQQFMRQPAPQLRGPLNWYRAREVTFKEELPLARAGVKLEMPAFFITATRDKSLPPHMSVGMEKHFKNLSRAEVNSSHWAPTHASGEVNALLAKWIEGVMDRGLKASL